MRKLVKLAVALSLVAGTGTIFDATPAQAASTVHGCQAGNVCIYPQNAGWNGDRPESTYYYYGYYNLSNMFGYHIIFNNQTGGATVTTCTGYNGTGCAGSLGPGWYSNENFTPINSIVLRP
jgi:hypothetical protein